MPVGPSGEVEAGHCPSSSGQFVKEFVKEFVKVRRCGLTLRHLRARPNVRSADVGREI